jgi:hypothetical protein
MVVPIAISVPLVPAASLLLAAHDALGDPAAGDCGARSTDFVHSGTKGRNTTAGSIAQALPGSIRNGNGYLCPCPVPGHGKGRGDRNPSLSIADGDDGKLLVRCFAGCDSLDVLAELRRRGLTDKPKASRRRDPFADYHRATGAPVQGDEASGPRGAFMGLSRGRKVIAKLRLAVDCVEAVTAYLIGALRKCETYAERQKWLQRAVDHLREGAERP